MSDEEIAAAPAPIRVVVIDDHEMFLESVAQRLGDEPDIDMVGVALTAADGVDLAVTTRPDVAVVDYQLPDGDGATLAASIRAASPDTQVLVLTGVPDERLFAAAVAAGCAGFLTKDKAFDELLVAVKHVHAGEPFLPPMMLASLLPRLRGDFHEVGDDLTTREREILQYLADGLGTQAIAAKLVLSVHTVRNHVQAVLAKLHAHSKLEAVAIAAKAGLISRSP